MAARSKGRGRVTPQGTGGDAVVRIKDHSAQRAQFRGVGMPNRQAFVSQAVARNSSHRGRR